MLATRRSGTEHDHWPLDKHSSSSQKLPVKRMSESYSTPLSTQSEWQGHFAYSHQDVAGNLPSPFDRDQDLSNSRYSKSSMDDKCPQPGIVHVKEERTPSQSSTAVLKSRASPAAQNSTKSEERSLPRIGDRSITIPKSTVNYSPAPASAVGRPGDLHEGWSDIGSRSIQEEHGAILKDEDDEMMDDDEEGDDDQATRPMTAAERSAARRKMKRFRLTHQQTRFLMSEFVKQPHPDAAHRERLSREIPGLSPRQVQVWFQNRRAKIKRLNAEDRDRVIKMRAVPEDFDNIQALHSPYGAVHGIGSALASPSEIGNRPYAEHLGRPLMVDVRRPDAEENISPTGLTPAFDGVAFNSSGASSSEMISSLSSTANDRYSYGSHFSPSFGGGSVAPGAFSGGQSRVDSALHLGHSGMRPLQPLHIRDALSRPRADSMQSPLRSSMSWKSETMDYPNYHQGSSTSPLAERQNSLYQAGSSTDTGISSYESEAYSSNSTHSSSALEYPSLQQSEAGKSRLRAASATFPLNIDLRNQYRPHGQGLQSHSSITNRSTPTSTQFSSPSIYTTSYPPAPLTAPINFTQSRSSGSRGEGQDIGAPAFGTSSSSNSNDFSRPSHGSVTGNTLSRTPLRDSFSGVTPLLSHHQERSGSLSDGLGLLQRKSSYTAPGETGGQNGASKTHAFDHKA